MFTPEELRAIYARLAEPFPDEAIERTRASETRKGYDTTGIKYQYVVNRLNEVLGVGGFCVTREFTLREKQSRSGYPMIEATCDLTMQLGRWVDGQFQVFAEASGTGGHTSATEADAKKGAFTNGFKKTAAFFGVGRQAYEGTLDDDAVPAVERAPATQAATLRSERQARPAARDQQRRGAAGDNAAGRITSAQLAKLRELVAELGGNWAEYREHVRDKRGMNVEYADKKTASELINALLARARKGNGSDARVG